MPEYVLNRTYTLRSLSGRIFNFEKGVPVWVTPEAEKEALQIGAMPVDGHKDILDPDAPPPLPELSAAERLIMLKEVFAALEKTNVREDFTAQGIPTLDALKKAAGFVVTTKERDTAWLAYKQGDD